MVNYSDKHSELLNGIHETYVRKNHDYGNSFSRSLEKYGLIAAMVRMEDKMNRLESLVVNGNQMVKDESIRDTLLDLANYAIMTVMEIDNAPFNCNEGRYVEQD